MHFIQSSLGVFPFFLKRKLLSFFLFPSLLGPFWGIPCRTKHCKTQFIARRRVTTSYNTTNILHRLFEFSRSKSYIKVSLLQRKSYYKESRRDTRRQTKAYIIVSSPQRLKHTHTTTTSFTLQGNAPTAKLRSHRRSATALHLARRLTLKPREREA